MKRLKNAVATANIAKGIMVPTLQMKMKDLSLSFPINLDIGWEGTSINPAADNDVYVNDDGYICVKNEDDYISSNIPVNILMGISTDFNPEYEEI